MESNKTAMMLAIEEIENKRTRNDSSDKIVFMNDFSNFLLSLLPVEKQQIKDAYRVGYGKDCPVEETEAYYSSTYKTETDERSSTKAAS